MKLQFFKVTKILKIFSKGVNFFLWVLFIVILVADIFVLKNSFNYIKSVNQETVISIKSRGVRINFEVYHKVEKRIDDAKNYDAKEIVVSDPFSVYQPQGTLP